MKKLLVSTLALSLLVSMNAFGAATASSSSSSTPSKIEIPGTGTGALINGNVVAFYRDIKNAKLSYLSKNIHFSPDDRMLAYRSSDGKAVSLYSTTVTKIIEKLKPRNSIVGVAFTPHGSLVFATYEICAPMVYYSDTKKRIFEMSNKLLSDKYKKQLLGEKKILVAINPTNRNRIMAAFDFRRGLDIIQDNNLTPTQKQELLKEWALEPNNNSYWNDQAEFSSDKKTLITRGRNKPNLRLWSTDTQQCIGTWQPQDDGTYEKDRYNWNLGTLIFSNDAKKIAATLYRRIKTQYKYDFIETIVIVWDLDLQKRTETLQQKCARIIRKHNLDASLLPQLIVDKIYPNNGHEPEEGSNKENQ